MFRIMSTGVAGGTMGPWYHLEKGISLEIPTGKKLNVNISIEGYLVANNDQLPDILHTLYFIEAQFYTINNIIIY